MAADNQPMFTAKVKIKRNRLPSAPIHVKIDAVPEDPNDPNRTNIPTRMGSSTLKSDARSAFGASSKPYRSPRWSANTAFKMPSRMKFDDPED
jgi:hypothetical protein